MWLARLPIKWKLMAVMLLTSGVVVLLTLAAFLAYEFFTYRKTAFSELSSVASIVATNSTAALAFDSPEEAAEILSALRAESHIILAGLYDKNGNVFSVYPKGAAANLPPFTGEEGYALKGGYLEGFQPVVQGNTRLGTLFIRSNMAEAKERFQLYFILSGVMAVGALILAFIVSSRLQKRISRPILSLARTAAQVSASRDYSLRATKENNDEIGSLTDAFNNMLAEMESQHREVQSFNQKLEAMVAARTRELEAANRELESFSYSVSHDLRAPLRSIHGYMNIFEEEYGGKLDDEATRLISIIQHNARRMGQLIDDLLSFSRLGRKELMKGTISMEDMVDSIWEELRREQDGRDIEFNRAPLPPAFADSVTMRHVWTNLLSNALKYTGHKPKAVIEVGGSVEGDRVLYFVRDNGSGFDMRYYEKLFGVFQRLHSQEEFEGTGVGLAIVQRILHRHGGTIWADARPDEGATFYFALPRH
jgi:signal transduction histidine kinase